MDGDRYLLLTKFDLATHHIASGTHRTRRDDGVADLLIRGVIVVVEAQLRGVVDIQT